jgi:hypothetical protein
MELQMIIGSVVKRYDFVPECIGEPVRAPKRVNFERDIDFPVFSWKRVKASYENLWHVGWECAGVMYSHLLPACWKSVQRGSE